jgi:hypothetical protein
MSSLIETLRREFPDKQITDVSNFPKQKMSQILNLTKKTDKIICFLNNYECNEILISVKGNHFQFDNNTYSINEIIKHIKMIFNGKTQNCVVCYCGQGEKNPNPNVKKIMFYNCSICTTILCNECINNIVNNNEYFTCPICRASIDEFMNGK